MPCVRVRACSVRRDQVSNVLQQPQCPCVSLWGMRRRLLHVQQPTTNNPTTPLHGPQPSRTTTRRCARVSPAPLSLLPRPLPLTSRQLPCHPGANAMTAAASATLTAASARAPGPAGPAPAGPALARDRDQAPARAATSGSGTALARPAAAQAAAAAYPSAPGPPTGSRPCAYTYTA
ncbi:hypothetical protein GY45DRAFT_572663 [Cubamyces sp. BRFM 1775]|nr:hypothetical protein GY45DRAFT_572663 [Cubamyces sp. BRFM 1775]